MSAQTLSVSYSENPILAYFSDHSLISDPAFQTVHYKSLIPVGLFGYTEGPPLSLPDWP